MPAKPKLKRMPPSPPNTLHDVAGFVPPKMIYQGYNLTAPGSETGLTQAYQNT
jgi:hypothetical protein